MGRRVVSLLVVLALAAAGACANDFDALFQPTDIADASPDAIAPSEAGITNESGVRVDGGTDAEAAAPRCSPPITTCPAQQDCNSDDECDFACAGCECPCSLDCTIFPKSEDPDCRGTCTGGAVCDAGCATGGPCELRTKDSDSTFWCSGIATSCTQRCEGKSNYCNVKCEITGACRVECRDGIPCLLECGANATSCTMADCPADKLKECVPGKRYACNRACPN